MKKTYINPEMEVVKIGMQSIICLSKVGEITDPLAPGQEEPDPNMFGF